MQLHIVPHDEQNSTTAILLSNLKSVDSVHVSVVCIAYHKNKVITFVFIL